MDVPRANVGRRRWIRRGVYSLLVIVLLAATTIGLSRLEPAAPGVERATLVMDKVKRGLMLRQVHGPGKLVPEETLWITVAAEGRVERLPLQPGVMVEADTVLVELSNPQMELEALNALWAMRSAEAELTSQKARLQNQLLEMDAALARLEANLQEARLQREVDEQLFKDELISERNLKLSVAKVQQLEQLIGIEQQRLKINRDSQDAQLAVQQAAVEQARAQHQLKLKQVESMKVRPGVDGILEQLKVEVGQRVTGGAILAKVTNPKRLKAQLRVPETQAPEVQIGQEVLIDLRNLVVPGRVVRVDPAVEAGTVAVDVAMTGELPRGSRPDLSVDGTIEIERLEDVLYVGRPVYGQGNSIVGLFKITEAGAKAIRVQVKFGRTSVNTIEVIQGLAEGDEIILSDTHEWDSHDRLSVN
jgi:HlyD family secretion protein